MTINEKFEQLEDRVSALEEKANYPMYISLSEPETKGFKPAVVFADSINHYEDEWVKASDYHNQIAELEEERDKWKLAANAEADLYEETRKELDSLGEAYNERMKDLTEVTCERDKLNNLYDKDEDGPFVIGDEVEILQGEYRGCRGTITDSEEDAFGTTLRVTLEDRNYWCMPDFIKKTRPS